MIKATVFTISDSCAEGQREDLSGPKVKEMLESDGIEVGEICVICDDADMIARELAGLCDSGEVDVIVTTGGTGLGPRDVTPEATMGVCERMVPGLMEATRAEGYKKTPNAILSRGVAGVRGGTLIINLPGSVKAVTECMEIILPVLDHAVKMMAGGGH